MTAAAGGDYYCSMATSAELLALVDAALEARLSGRPVDQYSTDGVNVAYMSVKDLMEMRDKLRNEVAAGSRARLSYADVSSEVE